MSEFAEVEKFEKLDPELRAIAKGLSMGANREEIAESLGRSRRYVSSKATELEEKGVLNSEGKRSAKTWEITERYQPDSTSIAYEETLKSDYKLIMGSLDRDITQKEISESTGRHRDRISSRINTLVKNGVMAAEGSTSSRKYFAGERLIERLRARDKINNNGEVPGFSDEELEVLDRLAYRMEENREDYRMPELDKLDPFKDRRTEIHRDDVFNILQSSRRRDVLRYLDNMEKESEDIGSLAREIAALEQDKNPDLVDCDERKKVYVNLYQAHIGRMEAKGVVEDNDGEISPGHNFNAVKKYLQDSFKIDDRFEESTPVTDTGNGELAEAEVKKDKIAKFRLYKDVFEELENAFPIDTRKEKDYSEKDENTYRDSEQAQRVSKFTPVPVNGEKPSYRIEEIFEIGMDTEGTERSSNPSPLKNGHEAEIGHLESFVNSPEEKDLYEHAVSFLEENGETGYFDLAAEIVDRYSSSTADINRDHRFGERMVEVETAGRVLQNLRELDEVKYLEENDSYRLNQKQD